jgi:hypothetical protein
VSSLKRPFFEISVPPYINENGTLIAKPLLKETSWKIDPAVYDEIEKLVAKYLSPTLFPLK